MPKPATLDEWRPAAPAQPAPAAEAWCAEGMVYRFCGAAEARYAEGSGGMNPAKCRMAVLRALQATLPRTAGERARRPIYSAYGVAPGWMRHPLPQN